MRLRAARSLLYAQADIAWNAALSGEVLSGIESAAVSATAFQVTDLCARAVNAAYRLASGSSVYAGGPVERRVRDMHAATQHAWNHSQHAAALGAALLG
jgi:indole-3-acetate monooxygenase